VPPIDSRAPSVVVCACDNSTTNSGDTAGADRNIGLITLYSNGFIIGNGEFRDHKDPKNKAVLDDLKKGEVPDELDAICRKVRHCIYAILGDRWSRSCGLFSLLSPRFVACGVVQEWGDNIDAVRVNLVDKTSEAYTPPPAKFDFAKSQGQSLGATSSSAAASAASFADATPKRLVVDAAQPTTSLQLVLADRKRVKETANQTATVMEVYQHVMSSVNARVAEHASACWLACCSDLTCSVSRPLSSVSV
jgi:hypothetical protein